jgi:hypothetical protein
LLYQKLRSRLLKIATTLRNLREYRNDCDYADSIENIDKIVRKALLDAEELLRVYREL